MNNKKVLLTGHKGFVGSNLLRKLKQLGHYVYCLEREDVVSDIELESMIKKCDVVFHVGAISDTELQDCNEMLEWNYNSSKIIFDLARKYDVKVVYSSSAANYGNGDGIPTNIYGWSKLLAEEYGLKACQKFVALRYFNVYGPGEENKGKMASVAYQAWIAKKFMLFPGDIKRDFIYIDDVVNANIHASTLERGVFDVGTGKADTFQNLVDGVGIPYEYHSKNKIPSWYQHFTQADKNKFMPGWEPLYNVHSGTEKYRDYLRQEAF